MKKIDQPVMIQANDAQIKQVFINLIKNSIEAISERGRITIDVRVVEKEAVVTIADNGIGMEPESISSELANYFILQRKKVRALVLPYVKKLFNDIKERFPLRVKKIKGQLLQYGFH